MNLYFFAPEQLPTAQEESVQEILALLKRAEVNLSSNRGDRVDLGTESAQEIESRGATLLEAMHALVLEASISDSQLGYLLAFALTQKLPLLLLIAKGSDSAHLATLTMNKLPKHITLVWYTPEMLHGIIEKFLGQLAKVTIRETPDIKFTLRLTRTEERYLEYATRGSKKRKADILRELLDRDITRDEQFRAWLKKRQQ
ncbi:MAG: hypothetical protein WCV86_02940 [Patescibacteria group bacterium]|jgi:hypothetical protein